MRLLARICLLLVVPVMALGQSGAPGNGSSNGSVAEDLKTLREALAEQQKQISQQQQQITQQQQRIETLQQSLDARTSGAAHVENAAINSGAPPVAGTVASDQPEKAKESPLSFRIGGADFTPGGFVDFEQVFRTTNTGSNISTSFGAIPFSNTAQGHLTEYRATGQYSRLNLKASTKFGANNVNAYVEFDFNGNDATNVFVTSNSHTSRLRLYWLQLRRGNWEFLAGQSWGLLTPNRTGVSPFPQDLAITYNEDANVQVGINYTRAGQFRAAYHFNDNWAWAFGIENPEQFIGAAGEVIFPVAFSTVLTPQFDAANNTATPNVTPDFVTKLAVDKDFGKRHFHWEAGGLLTAVKATVVPIGGTSFQSHSTIGGGGQTAINFDLFKGFRVLANGIIGDGVGRYVIGLGPQAVVRAIQTGPAAFNIQTSMVHSGSGLVGVELQPGGSPKTQFGLYYGGAYFQRNAFIDVTSVAPNLIIPINCGGVLTLRPCIGFGGANSSNIANRAIQEATIDWTQALWRNPQYGAVLLVTQTSYVTRSPWFVAPGAPKNAHLVMGWLSVRYVLP
jgi:uncharacterized coiled-coil protein SlyX